MADKISPFYKLSSLTVFATPVFEYYCHKLTVLVLGHACVRIHVYVGIYLRIFICMDVCSMYVFIYVSMYVCLYVCMNVCMNVCIYLCMTFAFST